MVILIMIQNLTVIVNTRNEESNIERSLKSVKGFAGEIVVVDMESTDDTVKIAEKHGAKVYNHKYTHFVEPARNYAIGKAKDGWILILDADEEVGVELKEKLLQIIEKDSAEYVRLPRKNIIFDKWISHARWWPDYNIRFFKKGSVSWGDEIHSIPITQGRGIDLPPEEKLAIVHHNYQTIEQFIDRLNRYTTIQASEKIKKGYKFDWKDVIGAFTSEFVSRLFLGKGYKDGIHGLALSFLSGVSEAVVILKVWQETGFKEHKTPIESVSSELSKSIKEINYWKANELVGETGSLTAKIKRRLKI
jgi:glycosyltransferase involved in cell wall biosynthesis